MVLGKIIGKTSTTGFSFEVKEDARKFEYVQILDKDGNYILAQIMEIEKDRDKTLAYCHFIGYRDKNNKLSSLRTPPEPGTEVLDADDALIKKVLGLEKSKDSAFIGTLEGRDKIKIYLDFNKLLTRHVAVLAKTGAGKSYTVGVILEELLERKIPTVIIDPHGEYSTLKYPNPDNKDAMKKFDVKPKGFLNQIQEFSPDVKTNSECKPLKLSSKDLSSREIIHLMPAKLSSAQLGVIYSALKHLDNRVDFDELLLELHNVDSPSKWGVIDVFEYIKKLNLFSDSPTPMFELVKPSKTSIINLKGVNPEVQEVVVYKLVKDLFMERKRGNIPPFFLVVEEGHNFIPERSFGEAKSSGVLRQIFSEGRKFGLGICLVSQRPSRVEKNALSQVTTQIILKVTNPNDVKAITSSVEGITSEAGEEIKNLPIGTALVTGVVDLPIFVNIRPRKTKHGGAAVQILGEEVEEGVEESEELMPLIKQKITLKDLKLMHGKSKIKTVLVPCLFLSCSGEDGNFSLLINLNNGHLVQDIEKGTGIPIKAKGILDLSPQQKKVLKMALQLKEFRPAELFSKSGLQFSDLYDVISNLTKKNCLEKVGDKYRLGEALSVLADIKSFEVYEKVDYSSVGFDEKLETKVNKDSLIDFLGQFLDIKNEKECWLVVYELS